MNETIGHLLRNRDFMRRLARQLVQDESRVDDAVQDAWLMALRSPSTPTRPTRSWIATVVRNAVRQGWRREQRRQAHEEQAARPEATSPRPTLEHEEILQRVVGAVLSLDEPYRRALLLRFYEDLPPRRIAERLELPIETVRTRLKRGLAQLRARLDAGSSDRRSWLLALAPFVPPPSPIRSGAHAMIHSPLTWTTLLAVPIVLVASHFTASDEAVSESLPPVSRTEVDPLVVPASEGGSVSGASPSRTASSSSSASRGTANLAEAAVAPIVSSRASAHDDAVATVRGRLFDPDGAPVPGADLTLHGWGRSGKSEKQDVTSSSAADGTFEISITPNEENQYTLRVDHTELARIGWRWHELTKGQEIDLGDVTMPWTGRIEGRLLNEDREPIGDTRPILISIRAEPEGHFVPHRGTVYSASGVVDPLTSTFAMDGVPIGRSRLKLESHLGWSEGPEVEVTAGGLTPVDVVYAGHALKQVVYLWVASDVPSESIRMTGPSIEPRIPREGASSSYSHVFEDVPDGTYTITIQDPRYENEIIQTVEPGPVPVTVNLKPNSGLLLTVVDAEDGSIVPTCTFNGDPAGSGDPSQPMYRLEGIRNGRPVSYRVSAPGYAEVEGRLDRLQPGEYRSVQIGLSRAGSITGILKDADGNALPEAAITLFRPAEVDDSEESPYLSRNSMSNRDQYYRREVRSAVTDEHGQFAFPELPAGRFILRALTAGGLAAVATIDVGPEQRDHEIELAFPPGAIVHGKIIGPNDATSSSLWITIVPDPGDDRSARIRLEHLRGPSEKVDADGRFRFGPLPTRRALAWVGLDEHASLRRGAIDLGAIDIDGPGEIKRDFDLGHRFPGEVAVTVRIDGIAAPGATVALLQLEEGPVSHPSDWLQGAAAHGPTDNAGFMQSAIFGGTYRVAVAGPRWVYTFAETVEVVPGETTELNVDVVLYTNTVQLVDAQTEEPIEGAATAMRTKGLGNAGHASERTDLRGLIELTLPEGEYELFLLPRVGIDTTTEGNPPQVEFRWTAAGPEPAVLRFER